MRRQTSSAHQNDDLVEHEAVDKGLEVGHKILGVKHHDRPDALGAPRKTKLQQGGKRNARFLLFQTYKRHISTRGTLNIGRTARSLRRHLCNVVSGHLAKVADHHADALPVTIQAIKRLD